MTADVVVLTTALTLLTVIVWSCVVAVVDALAPPRVDDRQEGILLALMIAPTIVGVAAMVAESVSPSVTFTFTSLENAGVLGFHEAMQDAAANKRAVDWMKWAAFLGMGVYVVGVVAFIVRLTIHTVRLRRVAAHAKPMNHDLDCDIAITSEAVPPFVSLRGRIIVPSNLIETLTECQLSMIIDHERAHVRRGDPLLFLALSFVDALFWINPFVRRQTSRCRLAAEIACDNAVTRSAPLMRDAYAMTLVTVLKQGVGKAFASTPTLFSTRSKSEHQIRIRRIMARVAPECTRGGVAVLVGLAAMMAPLAIIQFAVAQSTSSQTPNFSVAPVEGRLMSGFGEYNHSVTKALEDGVIIAAPLETPVVAPAAGRVVLIASHPDGYGDFFLLDHGDGYVAGYGPQRELEVAVGDQVIAGQTIAHVASNNQGIAPFLFITVLKDGEPVDPASVISIPSSPS